MPLGLYVDGKDDAERGELVFFIQYLETVTVLKRGPRLFNARDHPFSLRDGKVEAHEAARNLPRKRIDRVALGKERKVPVQLHAPARNSQLIRARNGERNMLHKASLPPLHIRHDELAPKLEKHAVDLIFDVSVFVPDVKMVERENLLL